MFNNDVNAGKRLRSVVARSQQAEWKVPARRPSVERMITLSNYDRLPDLIPLRHYRMTQSPFVFYRATAGIMARDLSHTTSSGVIVQACGDCHLLNFGGFATPERHLVFDINDFDETHPGPWEWDVKRLATSFVLACREKGFDKTDADDVVYELITRYRDQLKAFASMKLLDLWYTRFDVEEIQQNVKETWIKDKIEKAITRANKQTHDHVFYKITSDNMGEYQIMDQPPLIRHPVNMKESMELVQAFLQQYKQTLQPDRRWLFEQYKVIDLALKVVGVGSVGTRCYILLLLNANKEPLLIQVKEARASVLANYTQSSKYTHHGERIVQGQRLIQAASDIFLGWSTGPEGRHAYFRQLRDKKLSADIESHDKTMLMAYARLCGGVLARAHCKTGKGAFIYGYAGKNDAFANAICRFAGSYADQTEKDYTVFMKAIQSGKLVMEKEPT